MHSDAEDVQVRQSLFLRRLVILSLTSALGLAVQVGYSVLVPKLPKQYAALVRTAVWDCVLVAVMAAQLVDLLPLWNTWFAGTDGGHFLPLAVLFYHLMMFCVCAVVDVFCQCGSARSRLRHRILVRRRVLAELVGGSSASRLLLGRVCFVVSGCAMGLALRASLWFADDPQVVLTISILAILVSHCAAGLAALDPRNTLPGQVVQWLCTGWGGREALVQGPLKVFGTLMLMPFAISVIAAQIWFRTLAFLVWLTVAWPCCRLHRDDSVYDAFEREVLLPLLQCSYLAFAGTLSAVVLSVSSLQPGQRLAVIAASVYYTCMLLMWTTPACLNAKVVGEEGFDIAAGYGDSADGGHAALLRAETGGQESEVELEDMRATLEELRALLQRERHDHSVAVNQMQDRLRDQELLTRSAERKLTESQKDAEVSHDNIRRLTSEVDELRGQCNQLANRAVTLRQQDESDEQLPRVSMAREASGRGVDARSGRQLLTTRLHCSSGSESEDVSWRRAKLASRPSKVHSVPELMPPAHSGDEDETSGGSASIARPRRGYSQERRAASASPKKDEKPWEDKSGGPPPPPPPAPAPPPPPENGNAHPEEAAAQSADEKEAPSEPRAETTAEPEDLAAEEVQEGTSEETPAPADDQLEGEQAKQTAEAAADDSAELRASDTEAAEGLGAAAPEASGGLAAEASDAAEESSNAAAQALSGNSATQDEAKEEMLKKKTADELPSVTADGGGGAEGFATPRESPQPSQSGGADAEDDALAGDLPSPLQAPVGPEDAPHTDQGDEAAGDDTAAVTDGDKTGGASEDLAEAEVGPDEQSSSTATQPSPSGEELPPAEDPDTA